MNVFGRINLKSKMAKRKSFLLRLNPELWEEINAWAQHDLRSVNGQIEFILRDAVRLRKKKIPDQIEEDDRSSQ